MTGINELDMACPNCDGRGWVAEYGFKDKDAPYDELEYSGIEIETCSMCKGRQILEIIDKRDIQLKSESRRKNKNGTN